MPKRRLEDRIRELCSQAAETGWKQVLSELQLAMQEHSRRVANLTMAAIVQRRPDIIQERRRNHPAAKDNYGPGGRSDR